MQQSASRNNSIKPTWSIYSASYARKTTGIVIAHQLVKLPFEEYQKMKMTNRILSHIATQMNAGRPLWAMLTANEYLAQNCSLRQALVVQAKRCLQSGPTVTSEKHLYLIDRILEGATLASLPQHTGKLIRRVETAHLTNAARQSSRLRFCQRLFAINAIKTKTNEKTKRAVESPV